MSTYYYLACDKHKEYCHGSTTGTSWHITFLCDSHVTLSPFITTHASCGQVRIAAEDDDSLLKYEEWTKHNVKKMYEKRRN